MKSHDSNQDELSQASRSLRAPTPQPTMATPGASVPSSPARPANLLDLPDELIHIILTFLDGRTALLLEAASPRFAGPCASPSLWRAYCVREYIYWDRRHSPRAQRRRPAGEVQWKEMYLYRGLGDQRVASIFNDVVGRQTKRYERYARIAAGYGNDAKDFLLRMTRADERSHPEDWLARRYHSRAIIEAINRSVACSVWHDMMLGIDVPLEHALGSFDLFMLGVEATDLEHITDYIEDLAAKLRRDHPDIAELPSREKALQVADYLLEKGITGMDPAREYHDADHSFIGVALSGESHSSLPLISAVIYCCVAMRFGLDASPCGIPFHVYVIVRPAPGYDMDDKPLPAAGQRSEAETEKESGSESESDSGLKYAMYLDPFRSSLEESVGDIRDLIDTLGTGNPPSRYLRPMSVSDTLLRCSANILASNGNLPLDITAATCAHHWTTALLTHPGASLLAAFTVLNCVKNLTRITAALFPSDLRLVRKYALPRFRGTDHYAHIEDFLDKHRRERDAPPKPRRRVAGDGLDRVMYRVGQVFRHVRYEYIAVITGWDTGCAAEEEWMEAMNVDFLPHGRNQCFYNVFVEDGSERYVAEENIGIITPELSELSDAFVDNVGQWFKRWDPETHSFVSNMLEEYPDD